MAIREYVCSECNLVQEIIMPTSAEPPQQVECRRCKKLSNLKQFSNVALLRSDMDNPNIDLAIGKDANEKWEDINKRIEERQKVRRESGSNDLIKTGPNEYQPLTSDDVAFKKELNQVVSDQGFKESYDNDQDAKIMKN